MITSRNKPLISVCIPFYQGSKTIGRCIKSLFAQDNFDLDQMEVIIANDSSDQDSVDCLKILSNKYPIIIHHNKTRLGLTKNWQKALSLGCGKIRTLLHQDDWYHPDCLRVVTNIFRDQPDAITVSVNSVVFNDYTQKTFLKEHKIHGVFSAEIYIQELLKFRDVPAPSVMFFKGNILDEAPVLYKTDYMFCPEFELYLRLCVENPQKLFINAKPFVVNRGVGEGRYSMAHRAYQLIDWCNIYLNYHTYIRMEEFKHHHKLCGYGPVIAIFERLCNSLDQIDPLIFRKTLSDIEKVGENPAFWNFLNLTPSIANHFKRRIKELSKAMPNFPIPVLLGGLKSFQDKDTDVIKSAVNGSSAIYGIKDIFIGLPGKRALFRFQRIKQRIEKLYPFKIQKKFDTNILNSVHFNQPIFIVGFHHSGTRLIAQLLEQMGVFQVITSPTHEWRYIQMLNTLLLPEWNSPKIIRSFRPWVCRYKINVTDLARRLWYNGYNGKRAWGHKDPRMGIVLTSWLKKFPKARVLHIVRNPVDVIGTLSAAYSKFTPDNKLPQQSVAFWADLWEVFIDKTYLSVKDLDNDNFIAVKFEDLCTNPQPVLQHIAGRLRLKRGIPDTGDLINADKIGIHKEWLAEGKLEQKAVEEIKQKLRKKLEYYEYI